MSLSSIVATFERRSALALAEAIIPGSATVPAADEATVAAVEEVVRNFDPRFTKAWELAQATLSAAAIRHGGRPFHMLSTTAQDALIRRWEDDPILSVPLGLVALVYKFVHFDLPQVYEKMGGKFNVVRELESPRWLEQIQPGNELPEGEDIECEVVVVGTGAGGAVVGKELADRGFAVVFVEEGEHYRRDAFDGSSVSAHRRFFRFALAVGNAAIPLFIGRMVGGGTAVNTGTCFRTPSWVLDRWCEEIGTDDFTPAAMERHFARVEGTLQVGPSETRVIGPIANAMARGCDKLGWSHGPVQRNAPGCDGSGFCDFGCRTDAKRGTNLAYIPPALEKGAMLFTGLRADSVLLERGRAVGIEAVAKNGRKVRVRAPTVILAGGAIPTPLFLLKQGIANRSGEVGKNLTLHPSGAMLARLPDSIGGPAHTPQGYMCDQFAREGMLILTAQPDYNVAGIVYPFAGRRLMETLDHFDQMAGFGMIVPDVSRGRVWRDVAGYTAISYNVAEQDVDRMHQAMIRTGEMCLAGGADKLYPVVLGTGVLEGQRGLDQFRKAKLTAKNIVWTSYHPLGTSKMGKDPATSVVDLDHQTHDVPGLFIVDGSTVPGPLGVNPQITIMGMATRAAERIAERIGTKSPAPSAATG
jgi:choline dehydrogenase-like flavoprotein